MRKRDTASVSADTVTYRMIDRGGSVPVSFPGMVAYTRRRLATGEVRIFLRSVAGTLTGQVVLSADAAAKIPPNKPMTFTAEK